MRYILIPGVFLLAVFSGDWVWAEVKGSQKAKPAVASAPRPQPASAAMLSVDEKNDLSEELLELSGLKKQWRGMAPASVYERSQWLHMGLVREEMALIDKVYSEVFDADSYYQVLHNTFKQGMNKPHMAGVSQWLKSPTGMKAVQAEQGSKAIDSNEKVAAMAAQIQAELPSKARLKAVKKIEKAMDLTPLFIALSLSQLQPFLPLDTAFEGGALKALLTDLSGSVWVEPLRERILLSLLYTYRSLTDEELVVFAGFAGSPQGVWFYQLRKKALLDAQIRLNEGVTEKVSMFEEAMASGKGRQFIRQMLPPGVRYVFARGRDPFNSLSHMKTEIGKVNFTRALYQDEEEERRSEIKLGNGKAPEKSQKRRFGPELKSLRAIPLEVYKILQRTNKDQYQHLEHYAFLFKDKKELTAAEDKDYLDAVAKYKELIEKTHKMKGEIILPSPLQVPYEELKPAGIIWSAKAPMALLETKDNQGYTVRKGSLVGPEYGVVESIDQNKIVVVERARDYLGNISSKNKEIEFVQSNKK